MASKNPEHIGPIVGRVMHRLERRRMWTAWSDNPYTADICDSEGELLTEVPLHLATEIIRLREAYLARDP